MTRPAHNLPERVAPSLQAQGQQFKVKQQKKLSHVAHEKPHSALGHTK